MPRARGREFLRNWNLVREIETSRRGKTLKELAEHFDVVERTIRRDIAVLQEAGMPIYHEVVEGVKRYKLQKDIFKGLFESGLTLSEVAALYMSRSLLECLGTPFQQDLESAFDKIEDALAPQLGKYLDELPQVFSSKGRPMVVRDRQHATMIAALQTAAIEHRKVRMRYHSISSAAEKDYLLHPQRLVNVDGTLYLIAHVPAYGEVRTFATPRVRKVQLLEERFRPADGTKGEPFPDSVGVFSGRPEWVEIEFAPSTAPHVAERRWHPSQVIEPLPDGGLRLRMKVSVDYALQSMILSFGPLARVVRPTRLAERILERLEEARDRYAPRLAFDQPPAEAEAASADTSQPELFMGPPETAPRTARRTR